MSREEFQGVKKNLLRTANDYDLESRNMNSTSSNAQTYTLADGHVISLGSDELTPAEVYFNPRLEPGLQQDVGLPDEDSSPRLLSPTLNLT